MTLSSTFKTWLGHGLRIAIGIVAVYLLIRTGALNPVLLGNAIARHPFDYGLAFLIYAGVLEAMAYLRWLWLLRAAGVSISAWEVLRLHLIGLFFSGFLPGGTGGDIVRGYYLLRGRSKTEGAAALGTMVVDRIVGLFGLIGLAAIANLVNMDVWRTSPRLGALAAFILGTAAVMIVLTGIYLSPWKLSAILPARKPQDGKKRGFMTELAATLTAFRDAPRVFLGAIAISMLVHFSLVVIYALCGKALDVSLPFRLHAYVAPTLTFVNGIPVSPAGLGVGEAAGRVLYRAVGATHGGAEIPALVHIIALLVALLCSPAYFFRPREKKPHEPQG